MAKKRLDLALFFFFLCKLWVENPISVLYKEQRVVIKVFLYDLYILTSFLGFRLYL